MSVSRDEILRIAELARLSFGKAEMETFTSQFQHILDYIEKLKEVNVDGVPPTSHVSQTAESQEHIFREDLVRESLATEEALANAPDSREGQFRVPKVL